jgi:hypothetical protein
MNIVLKYLDTENKTRWGYVTNETMARFATYHNQLKELKEDSGNEILRKNIEVMEEEKIELFLPDGRTGSPTLKAASMVAPFAIGSLQQEQKQVQEVQKV